MSNRVRKRTGRPARSTGRSYTERLQRTKAYRPPRQLPTWLTEARRITQPRMAALLLLVAETGHLAAAWTEWPAGTARGVFHVVVAGILGVAAVAIYFDPARIQLGIGIAATVMAPICWAVGAPAGLSPYMNHSGIAAGISTAVELVAAALLALGRLTHGPHITRRRRRERETDPEISTARLQDGGRRRGRARPAAG